MLSALVLALMLGFTPRAASLSTEEVEKDTPGARWEPCFEGGWSSLGEKKKPCQAYVLGGMIRGAWVIPETNEARARRLQPASIVMAQVAEENAKLWPGTVFEFAIAMTTASGWSTGFREDIQVGRARGPDGEFCLADTTLETARTYSNPEISSLPKAQLQRALVGKDTESMHRCFTVLARALANARNKARWMCPVARYRQPVIQSAFAVYGTGNRCVTGGKLWWAEGKRYRTFLKYTARSVPLWPAWYLPPAPWPEPVSTPSTAGQGLPWLR